MKSSLVVNGVSPNYILNGGFSKKTYKSALGEYVAEWSTDYWTTSGTISSRDIGGADQYALNMGVSSTATSSISQSVLLPAGEYTLSMNLDTNQLEDVEVTMKVSSLNRAKVYTETYSVGEQNIVSLNVTATDSVSNGEKFTVSISVSGGSGTPAGSYVTIDNVMLSNGIGLQAFDRVSFGHFETTGVNTTHSIANVWGTSSGPPTTVKNDQTIFGNALFIQGALDQEKYAYQSVYLSDIDDFGSEIKYSGDLTFKVTGFAKGTHQMDNESSAFRLRVEVRYANGFIQTETFDFISSQTEWQFVSGLFTLYDHEEADDAVENIKILCDYFNNPGEAYFDNITVTYVDDDAAIYEYYEDTGLTKSLRPRYITRNGISTITMAIS